MAYDLARGGVLLFGGHSGGSPVADGTWILRAGGWEELPSAAPRSRTGHDVAYDDLRGRIALFGGRTIISPETKNDVYDWHAHTFTDPAPASPTARHRHAMTFDPVTGSSFVFGGQSDSNAILSDAWRWGGSEWESVPASGGIPALHGHAMTSDRHRQRVVLFGGKGSDGTLRDDLWEHDGQSWALREPPVGTSSPPARENHAIAYDMHRKRTVLFGGRDSGNNLLGDTWEWDGTRWTQLAPARAPASRDNHVLVYEPSLRKVVLMGGTVASGSRADLWVWDGEQNTWTEIAAFGGTPFPQWGHAMAYNALRRELVLFGLHDEDTPINPFVAVWHFQYRVPGQPAESCRFGVDGDGDGLIGCEDPDCWGYCTPFCPPDTSCSETASRCGDGDCNESLENSRLCPGDCPGAPLCGDFFCDAPESAATCPGDCR
jgi:hypothetical protein